MPQKPESHWFYVELDPPKGFERSEHYDIEPNDPFAIELEVPVDPYRPGFIRVEIEDDILGPYNDTKTISNPIYFGDRGDECASSEPLY